MREKQWLGSKTYTSPQLVNEEERFAEWRIFKRALAKEKKTMMEKKKMSKSPSLQDVKTEMELSGAYRGIFPEIFKLLDILYPSCGNSYSGMFV